MTNNFYKLLHLKPILFCVVEESKKIFKPAIIGGAREMQLPRELVKSDFALLQITEIVIWMITWRQSVPRVIASTPTVCYMETNGI